MIVKKPTIVIYKNRADADLLREICAGIEEEGVLFEMTEDTMSDSTALACRAAEASMLGSGVGIFEKDISLHIRGMQYEKDTDVLLSTKASKTDARNIGTNAARVIKKQPFRLTDEN